MAEKRFAILIANSKFPDEPGLTELRCPENDVDALNEVLASPDFGQFNKVIALKNRPNHEVLEQLEMLLHEAGREDLVLVYFSGHGKLNASGQLCLATANTKLRLARPVHQASGGGHPQRRGRQRRGRLGGHSRAVRSCL